MIYFFVTLPSVNSGSWGAFVHLGYLTGTGYYQLYYLLVVMEFYLVFPLLVALLRRTAGHHVALLVASGLVQILTVGLMHWNVLPVDMRGFWATRELTSYQFYLIAGMVVAIHLDEVHHWLVTHTRQVLVALVVSAGVAEGWYVLASKHVASWMGSSSDPFQPVVIPFNIAAIAAIYLLGVALVHHRRSDRTRKAVQSGSDNAYGIYLAQMLFIVMLTWLGWSHLRSTVPWPILCLVTVAFVFLACIGLTAILARTPLAKALTGRSQVAWPHRRRPGSVDPIATEPIAKDAGTTSPLELAETG